MKMAMVVHSYYPADVRVRRECEALADRGDRVDMICLQKPGESACETVGNVDIHRLPVQHHRGHGQLAYIVEYLNFFLRAFWCLTRLHLREKYPVVQVHNLPDFLVFVTLVPKLLGARILLDMHDITPELFQSLYGISEKSRTFKLLCLAERLSLAYADGVLTVNENIRDLFLTRNPIARKLEVVMNAPDPRYFTPKGSGASTQTAFAACSITARSCGATALRSPWRAFAGPGRKFPGSNLIFTAMAKTPTFRNSKTIFTRTG